jgi:hypothetical protein
MNALENYYKQRDTVTAECTYLTQLANAFHETGNRTVAEALWSAVEAIEFSVKNIGDAYCEETNKYIQESNAQLGKLLTTMMDKT